MKGNFWKMSLATALTLTGVVAAVPQKMVHAAILKEPIKRVQINCLPGKSAKVWTSYEGGQLINFQAKNKSKWNVAETAVDRKGRLWYKIGYDEWIQARYTEDLEEKEAGSKVDKPAATRAPKKKVKKAKKKPEIQSQAKQPVKPAAPRPVVTKPVQVSTKPSKTRPSTVPAVTSPSPAPVPTGPSSQRAQAVVNLAKSQVGKGYAWGGNGPDNFDCSGLVQFIYSQVGGVQLPRVTTDQVKVGTTVAMDQLQAGDLLYWGSVDAPYHVGIYIGNNQYVHAATPDQGVVLQVISSYFYPCVAKRVIQ
ncbi:C40 family peptidase [Lactobacillus xylocopicola]|uniref:Hydrolase n=1 Tax=Lactobacillus xylocopicola TaxID=2976676 RepID=A0ABN6SNZ5_9LACO|nr:C40 family peptidase [Lactobacillus xylocopicola]BDR61041.1 hydrolase [Lactobacillus xylocopicola]